MLTPLQPSNPPVLTSGITVPQKGFPIVKALSSLREEAQKKRVPCATGCAVSPLVCDVPLVCVWPYPAVPRPVRPFFSVSTLLRSGAAVPDGWLEGVPCIPGDSVQLHVGKPHRQTTAATQRFGGRYQEQ